MENAISSIEPNYNRAVHKQREQKPAEGKGVSVRWDREAAHADKDDKCSERGGEEGVSSNHGVVAKG
ncbi:unnamed protein product, partial [Vitis vinifera]|uniref:Uncharacterized protein n=1 Tax=Vitis vinifera TaxID=29760 RepID=D7SH93_VITVI